jgi:glutamate-1-semialdehyde 2,1-aminomutase
MTRTILSKASLVDEYIKKHPGSKRWHDQAAQVFSANGATHAARILDPFRPYITRAKGVRKWDVDGNEYIDYVMGHGALILGHSHPEWVKAIQEQVAKGVHFGEGHQLEVEWAKSINSMMPVAERVEFCACGQEANLMGIRLARIFTGRKKILRFVENFHGWADEVAPEGSAGVSTPDVKIIPMNDLDLLEAELATREYALVMTEGGGAHMAGQIPWDTDFIRALSGIARKYGTLWLIDEVVTGFRDDRGGWQALIGVKPDLASLGKCASGGLAIGVLVGRADVFEAFNPKTPVERRMRHTGTWNANPLLSSAGVAACKLYRDGEPQKKATEMASYLRREGNKILMQRKISGRLYGRTIVHLYLGPVDLEPQDEFSPPTRDVAKIMSPEMTAVKAVLCLHLLNRGIATMGSRTFILSVAHQKSDVDQTMEAFASSLDDMVAEGLLETTKS